MEQWIKMKYHMPIVTLIIPDRNPIELYEIYLFFARIEWYKGPYSPLSVAACNC